MAAQRWRRIVNNILDTWMTSALALDPMAYAAAMQAGNLDAWEAMAITTHHGDHARVAQTAPATAQPSVAALRLDGVAG